MAVYQCLSAHGTRYVYCGEVDSVRPDGTSGGQIVMSDIEDRRYAAYEDSVRMSNVFSAFDTRVKQYKKNTGGRNPNAVTKNELWEDAVLAVCPTFKTIPPRVLRDR